MLPSPYHPKWRMLVLGECDHQFKLVAASMIVARLRRTVKADGSEKCIQACVGELIAFMSKYEAVVKDDLAAVFK